MIEERKPYYKIVTAEDGQHWVTLQALLAEADYQIEQIDHEKSSEEAVASLKLVRGFVHALCVEGDQQHYSETVAKDAANE